MTGMIMDPKLFFNDRGDNDRGPYAGVQTLSDRTTLDNIRQLLPVFPIQLALSATPMPFQQSGFLIGIPVMNP